ncbi:MAG: SusD/RagB family nutrient-binding outer membrane lipoprotein [Muribaculaceae bacterium]|nr:SusD/RagB family nutrient-binding outer membrane lipoprotein [Muribaculaceae bacterium]
MNKIKITVLLLLTCLIGVSCEDMLDDNVNPDKAHSINVQVAMPVVVFYAQQINYDHAEYYNYFSQFLTTGGKSSVGAYSYKCEWEMLTMNRHPQWRRHFYDIGVNGKNLIQYSQEINSPNYELIARTIKLMSTQLTTDAFGDMPRSQAYLTNAPTYDTQESIYKWMFEEADELISLYENPEYAQNEHNLEIDVTQDRVYAGDLEKWKGLVYAIKARLLLRNIPNVDRSPAMCQKIIAAADAAINQWRKGDLLYGEWFGNEPRYNFDGGTGTQNCVWSLSKPVINSWESRANLLDGAIPSKYFMVDVLGISAPDNERYCGTYNGGTASSFQGYANDPRCVLLMIPRTGPQSPSNTTASVIKMRYLENNIGMSTSYKIANYPNLYMGAYCGDPTGYNPIFTMEELYFIKAEALYWLGDKAGACALAKEATEHNIQRHLDFFLEKYPNPNYNENTDNKYPGQATVSGVPGYTQAQYWEGQVNSFLNNEEFYTYTYKPDGSINKATLRVPKVTDRGNKHWFFNPSEYTLSDLMIQKYIAMVYQPEMWTDMRRYHYSNKRNNYGIGNDNEIIYPNLRRPYNLYAPYWVDGLTEAQKENAWIQRLNYDPETEEKYNRSELQRLGAYKNYKWLQEPMIWSHAYGEVTSLTGE